MFRRAAITIIVSLGLLTACGSDGADTSDGAGATPVASDSPAPAPTGNGGGGGGGAVDCAAASDAFGSAIVNIQIISQLPSQTDVSQWVTVVGTMPEFAAQLDVLGVAVAGDAEASAAVDFYKGANEIAQRGYAGDGAAPAELAAYLGSDLMDTLSKKVPIGIALDTAGC